MSKTRTFIAVEISPEVRGAALGLSRLLEPHSGDVRWVPEENLHFTLQFLGDVSDHEVYEICTAAKRMAENCEPFVLHVQGAGAFPSVENPRTLWIGASDGSDDLKALHTQLGDAMAEIGFRGESRPYVPHMTLGKGGRAPGAVSPELSTTLAEHADYDAGGCLVTGVTVFASELLRDGPVYTVLARCPF